MLYTPIDVLGELEKQVKELGSQKAWADKYGFDPAHINNVLRAKVKIPKKIAYILGYSPTTFYFKENR